jgi:hypothetical protein
MGQGEVMKALGEWASDQWGLVTAAQARQGGIAGVQLLRLVRAGLLESVGHGVYQVVAVAPPEHLEIKIAWLRLDPVTPAWQRKAGALESGVVSHASACELHGLGDLPSDRVELSVPRRRTTREESVLLHQAQVDAEDITVVDGLPVTTVDRTIADLLRSRIDGAHAGTVIADADLRGLLDSDRLAARIAPFTRAYGLPPAASGADLVEALCAQAGRTLHSQETEHAAAAGFASAVSAMEELYGAPADVTGTRGGAQRPFATPSALERAQRSRRLWESLAAQPSALEQALERSLKHQEAWQALIARPSALERALEQAQKSQRLWESLTARPSALERALEQAQKSQRLWESLTARPSALERALEQAQKSQRLWESLAQPSPVGPAVARGIRIPPSGHPASADENENENENG